MTSPDKYDNDNNSQVVTAARVKAAGSDTEATKSGNISLQVPTLAEVSPSSPTTTATSEPTHAEQSKHVRNLSKVSDFTDATTKMQSKLWQGDTKIQMDEKLVSEKEEKTDDSGADEISKWAKIKANLKGRTRKGRVAAQERALQEEKERMQNIDPTPFPFGPTQLADLVDPKSVAKLSKMGGVDRLLAGLGTDSIKGLDNESQSPSNQEKEGWVIATSGDRSRVYGSNSLPVKEGKSLLLLMWLALQDRILILLIIAAIISLSLGLYTDLGAPPEMVPCENPPPGETECELPGVDWVEGVAILVAVAIVDIVGSLNDWQKERQFKVLNAKREERDVQILRQAEPMLISVHDVQVGDICQIEPGEIIPCDGIFLRGHNVKIDESAATGESDLIRKVPYDECVQDLEKAEQEGTKPANRDCFLISGSRCLEGSGDYCVIAVGPNSFNGKLLMSLRTDAEMTPLQVKLNRLAEIIAYCGTAAGATLFVALMIRFFVQLAHPVNGIQLTANQKAQNFIDILISAVVIIVVAVPEGLPLAVTLALAFATKRMTKENLLVRMLAACETSANVSVICTDKTGTLTQNEMQVVAGSIGVSLQFATNHNTERIEGNEGDENKWSIDQKDLGSYINGPARQLMNDAIAVNSTAFEEANDEEVDEDNASLSVLQRVKLLLRLTKKRAKTVKGSKNSESSTHFVGSKTETALLNMSRELGWDDYRSTRARSEVVTSFPFSSERKAMAVVVKIEQGGYRLHVKGASEILTKACSRYVEVDRESPSSDISTIAFTTETKEKMAKTITFYANQTLRTIALCYKDYESWPPKEAVMDEDGQIKYDSLATDMTLLAITAIEDPLRPGVKEAVADCGKAGVAVKMCTGDNILTAKSIATQCGIFSEGGIIMEGPEFRKLNVTDMMEIVPRLQVLARCSPEDKKVLVDCLKSMDNIVAVTGDGTNDSSALKTANVGFSMGIAGTEVAREASDIILMDDNFASIVTAIMWGRCVGDSVAKFVQFQISVNIGAVVITFISAVSSADETAVFSAVQLLWINLIMDTLAALALATDPASPELLKRKPGNKNAPLITTDMWKQILGQASVQIAFILTLYFAGKQLLSMDAVDELTRIHDDNLLRALIFNTYVFLQLFNLPNCRVLDRQLNIFKGLHRNGWFISILIIEVALQVLIAYKGGAAFSVVPMGGREWAITIVGGFIVWPTGVLIRLIPTEPIHQFLIRYKMMPDPNSLPRHKINFDDNVEQFKKDWDDPAILEVAEGLETFNRIRGGRSARLRHRMQRKSKRKDVKSTGILAMVPAIAASGVGFDWKSSSKGASC